MYLPYPKKKYWLSIAISYLIATVTNVFVKLFLDLEIVIYVNILMIMYWILIEIRRFHDANRSGWLALINLIPCIGFIIAVIVAGTMESNYKDNKWMSE